MTRTRLAPLILVLFAGFVNAQPKFEPEPACDAGNLVCSGKVFGELRTTSCRTDDLIYGEYYWVYASAGRYLTFVAESNIHFSPTLVLLDGAGEFLAWDSTPNPQRSELAVTAPYTGEYWLLVTAQRPNTWGTYSITLACTTTPTCIAPMITVQPKDAMVKRGESAILTIGVIGTDVKYEWYRGFGGISSDLVGNGPSYQTPPAERTEWFWVRASNRCGQESSRIARVFMLEQRRRAIRPR